MPRAGRARVVTAAETRQYLAKAAEFLAVAEDCLEAGRYIAATGNAVHAGINAADAVCGARTGHRSTSQDHAQALRLLNEAGADGKEVAKHLARLLPLKTKAEYDPQAVPKGVASKAVEAARKAVAVAGRSVHPA